MAEYVDRFALRDALYDADAITMLGIKIINQFPTAVDAVPVVRCKDCKHMEIDRGGRFCHVWGGYNGMGDDGFCNYGERKEGADDGKEESDSGGV